MRLIKQTYQVVTPESAEHGDYAECGCVDEDVVEIVPDSYDIDEQETDDLEQAEIAAAVKLACEHITQYGCVEPSSWPGHYSGTWYTTTDSHRDYQDGSETTYSFHLSGFSVQEERAIYAALVHRTARA